MVISIFNSLIILTLLFYIYILCGGCNTLGYINAWRYKRKYNQFKNELTSGKWYYDIWTYNDRRKCVLSLYDDMTYTLSVYRKDNNINSNNDSEIIVMEEGIYKIVNLELKSSMCRVDLIGNSDTDNSIIQRFDMLLYNSKNKNKIDAFRKDIDFYDKDACVVFYRF